MDEMSDEVREWCAENGIEVGADGIPVREAALSPTRPCIRCSNPAECAPDSVIWRGSEVKSGPLCGDCYRLSYTDHRAYFDGYTWSPDPPATD